MKRNCPDIPHVGQQRRNNNCGVFPPTRAKQNEDDSASQLVPVDVSENIGIIALPVNFEEAFCARMVKKCSAKTEQLEIGHLLAIRSGRRF